MIKEILSNNFNINIHKEGVNPPSTSEVISNNFNININKIIYVPLESISLNPKNYVLNTEQTLKLEVTFTPEHATNKNVIFSSSNTRVATVDETGLVTPIDAGDVIITAISEDGNKVATSNITVVKLVTSISDVVVGNTDSNGNYKLTYIVSNFKEDSLVHRLKIGNNNYITINPNRSGNIYTYNGSGLSLGEYTCTIHVSDGYNNLTSNPFKIIIPDKEDGIKPLLKQAKDNYDAKYEILKLTISSIIEDGIFNEEEKEIIKNARIEYDESLANFNKVSQQCIDAIASKKADDAETNSKKHTEAEIKVVSDAISLKVSQTEYDSNKNEVSNKFTEIKQTTDSITSTVSKKVGKDEVVSSINQSAEKIKVQANKIQLEGTTTMGSDSLGRYLKNEKEALKAYMGGKHIMTYGSTYDNRISANVPALMMGAFGMNEASTGQDGRYMFMSHDSQGYAINYRSIVDSKGYWSRVYFDNYGYLNTNSRKFIINVSDGLQVKGNTTIEGSTSLTGNISANNATFNNVTSPYLAAGQSQMQIVLSNSPGDAITPNWDGRNRYDIGRADYRWRTLFCTSSPDISSDARLKENISYIDSPTKISTNEVAATSDMYNFVKDELRLAEYNYLEEDKSTIGFIAQDIVDTKVGSKFVHSDDDGYLSYDSGAYTNVLAGALQEALKQIEELKKEIEELKSNR